MSDDAHEIEGASYARQHCGFDRILSCSCGFAAKGDTWEAGAVMDEHLEAEDAP